MDASWVIFERRTCQAGLPAEGTVACIVCGAQEEIGAVASAEEGEEIHRAFAEQHAGCADSCIVPRPVGRVPDSSIEGLA